MSTGSWHLGEITIVYIDVNNTDMSWQDVYRLAITFVNPRPIAFVSTLSFDGVPNLAPFSFYTMVSANPPVLMVCPSRKRDGSEKDTLRNIEATGEFVVASVTEAMTEGMNQASAPYPPGVDEFVESGFTPKPSSIVKPPRVAESPVNCECVLDHIVNFGHQPGAGAAIFGRIVAMDLKDACLAADGLPDPDKLRLIGRMGRLTYVRTTDHFDLPRAEASMESTHGA